MNNDVAGLKATFRPLEQWPGKPTPSYARKRSTFRASYPDTLALLASEIEKLNGKGIVIQAYFTRGEIRNDGWPRSSARPSQPGVIVSFHAAKGALSFPCDTFDAWEDNLRAIAKSLEALRQVDRYGVTRSSEQYRGFAQIEAPGAAKSMDKSSAEAFIRAHGNGSGTLPDAYRYAARVLHPDMSTGSHEQFVKLQEAKRILGL